MKIISFSLSDKNVKDMETIQDSWGLSNKSEVVRAGLREALQKIETEKQLQGKICALIILQHSHETEKFVSDIKHEFIKLIKSQNHAEVETDYCIDVFLLKGNADEIKKMKNALGNNRKIKKIEMVLLK